MLDRNKIRTMSRLARMEQRYGREIRHARDYYRTDYISVRMLKNGLRLTLAFVIGLCLWACYNLDAVMDRLNRLEFRGLIVGICAAYAACMIGGLVLTYIMARKSYFRTRATFQSYRVLLEKLSEDEDGKPQEEM